MRFPHGTCITPAYRSRYRYAVLENQKRIGYDFHSLLNQGASPDDISTMERHLGLRFNPEMIELYFLHNGSNPSGLPSGKTGIFPSHNWLSLEDVFQSYKQQIQFRESFSNNEKNYTPGLNLFPFRSDGAGNYFWIDLNPDNKHYNQIYWTNTFGDEPNYVSGSLTDFLKDIADAYSENIFFIDEEGYLDCDWDRWKY